MENLNDQELEYKARLKEQQKLNKNKPKFFLQMKGFHAKEPYELVNREQQFLSLTEIQQLIIASFLPGPVLHFRPEWFSLQKSTKASFVCVFVLNFDPTSIQQNLTKMFKEIVRFDVLPDWIDQLLTINLSRNQTEKLKKSRWGPMKLEKADKSEDNLDLPKKDESFSKLDLLLSPVQMLEEGYGFPKLSSEIKGTTRRRYRPVTKDSPMFAIDCEMCQGFDNKSLLTRVSIVDENLKVVMDTLVKPRDAIKDYITRFSGITKSMLDPVKVTLSDVKKSIKKLIPRDAILCGHSLNNDLQALETFHPYVIDTSVIYNISGIRSFKPGLANLSLLFLNEKIQQKRKGHCSVEDARATMKLVKLKLENRLIFADRVLNEKVASETPIVTLSNYFTMRDTNVKIFYDYIDIHNSKASIELASKKFITIYTSNDAHLLPSISHIVNVAKSICIVLTRDGHCYVNV